jgi:F-type H+-transporting ATPase subunit b
MYALLLFDGAQSGGQIAEIAETFGVDWPHLISQVISFSIVCALLYLFAYKPVLRTLAQRRQIIAQGLANSEKIKAELARTEAMRQEVLTHANEQANEMIEEARAAAARLREQETRKATSAAAQIISKAYEAAEQDHTRMLGQLKREVGRLVVQTTAAITGKILTTDDQQRLAEETARELTTR